MTDFTTSARLRYDIARSDGAFELLPSEDQERLVKLEKLVEVNRLAEQIERIMRDRDDKRAAADEIENLADGLQVRQRARSAMRDAAASLRADALSDKKWLADLEPKLAKLQASA